MNTMYDSEERNYTNRKANVIFDENIIMTVIKNKHTMNSVTIQFNMIPEYEKFDQLYLTIDFKPWDEEPIKLVKKTTRVTVPVGGFRKYNYVISGIIGESITILGEGEVSPEIF